MNCPQPNSVKEHALAGMRDWMEKAMLMESSTVLLPLLFKRGERRIPSNSSTETVEESAVSQNLSVSRTKQLSREKKFKKFEPVPKNVVPRTYPAIEA